MKNYQQHVATLQQRTEQALADLPFDGVVIHSGQLHYYFADDMNAPPKCDPHFKHWVPIDGPGHVVLIRSGQRPKLVANISEDYWYEPVNFSDPFWQSEFDFVQVKNDDAVVSELGTVANLAFVGECQSFAEKAGLSASAINPEQLVNRLNWNRSYKTAYEVDCVRKANELAAHAHRESRAAFEKGASELEIHYAYVRALKQLDCDLPYESIIALDEKGAFLHYVNKRSDVKGRVLLIDSGANYNGYASDITRTWTNDDADSVFVQLRDDMDAMEKELCDLVLSGVGYVDLQESAHQRIGKILSNAEILKVSGDDAFSRGLTRPFFPHGLGHFLGIQVHDVSGHQVNPDGGICKPPEIYPFLRTTRTLEPGHIVTIEPGLYFIEMLLRPFRKGADKDAFNWNLIEQLAPHGGVRIEDDILVTESSNENLTRPYHPE